MIADRMHAPFETTSWTELRALSASGPERRRQILDSLVGRYWPPVYAYLRSRGHQEADAADLTQGFFSDVVLRRGLFTRADSSRGRLRSLLLTALQRYCVDVHREQVARQDGRRLPPRRIKLEEASLERILAEPRDPDRAFDRRWALSLLERALHRTEEHYRAIDKRGHWELFKERVVVPASQGTKPPALDELCVRHGFATAARAAAAVQVVKQRVSVLFRRIIAETVEDGADIDAEVAELRHLLES